jgi:hypothetical protein
MAESESEQSNYPVNGEQQESNRCHGMLALMHAFSPPVAWTFPQVIHKIDNCSIEWKIRVFLVGSMENKPANLQSSCMDFPSIGFSWLLKAP